MDDAIIIADALGHPSLGTALTYAWLATCAYTWFAPVLFRRMIDRELKTVRLDPDF